MFLTVLDTNFLIDLLRNKAGIKDIADSFEYPKTTTINTFELYYGARRSAKPEKGMSEVSNLLNSLEVLEFDKSAALKAADIHAELVNYPRLKTGGMSREGCEQLVDKEA